MARLALHLPAAGQVQVAVYGADGRRVRDLTNAQFPAGETQLFWDVTDDLGRAATPGAYFLEARTADGTARTAKLIVAR
ncbi:MAG: T9SS type A sorting domain-containing protein [Candidatus Eisenbacteria bacterium]|nr:T9SS type A sorting domain-containing protein [Candidatus Eisenbacteria bacterium]